MKPHRHFLSLCLLLLGAALPASAQVPPFDMTEISAPGTTSPLLMTASDWQWEDFSLFGPDITYNVSRRIPGDDFRCLISSLTAPNWTGDPQDPAPGEVFFYTITGDDTWGENRHGSSIPIVERCPCSGLPPVAGRNIRLELVAGGFDRPVEVVSSPGDRSRLFVVEQHTGRIRVIQRGNVLGTDFLRVGNLATGNEQGLLSLAFHPDYETNGRLFVYYTERAGTAGLTVVEEYAVSADPNVADPVPMQRIFTLDQPFSNHNGGQLAFGPLDGMLYIGLGDGGSGNDPFDAGQDLGNLLAKILRIDVDVPNGYVIPADNPFENDGDPTTRGEIWSWGVRNPWRFTFDRMTGDLYIGDVGQNCFEEVTVSLAAEAGVNHGWDLMEADTCFIDTQPNRCRDDCASCSSVSNAGLTCADLRGPVVELDQGTTGACSVISGYAYRGCRLPDLAGTYFYSDWCAEFVRTFELDPGPPLAAVNADDFTSQVPPINSPSAFGQDVQGEMYLVNLSGEVHRIVPN